ncbi:hypothetical protein Prum_089410 [Phytohabitans rumicis]|uniref:Uncharacterized protein n=1 Tax=Phytohabitans rumicis TaxID=1076125 RepID=A0A6V8LKY8_9ACTN|nr:hypothetical protein Prum_089410 [Phytohabitans rumicis]
MTPVSKPAVATEPVRSSTSSGTANCEKESPKTDRICDAQKAVKWRLRRGAGAATVGDSAAGIG